MFDEAPALLELASSLSVETLMIQPMDNFGGWPTGSERGEWSKRKAERWLELCSRLKVEQLQVCSGSSVVSSHCLADDYLGRIELPC